MASPSVAFASGSRGRLRGRLTRSPALRAILLRRCQLRTSVRFAARARAASTVYAAGSAAAAAASLAATSSSEDSAVLSPACDASIGLTSYNSSKVTP